MRVLLHIGLHKTGSTAIQRFLHLNRERLLREHGICYPGAGLIRTVHHLAAWSLQEPLRSAWAKRIGFKQPAELLFPEMLEEAARAGARAAVISSEEFSLIEAYRLERLRRVLDGHDIQVIGYARRQDRYVEALYGQMVKAPFQRLAVDIGKFVDRRLAKGGLDYHRYFLRWAQAFGRDAVAVREYSRARFPEGDVRLDFCGRMGLDSTRGLELAPHSDNESMASDSIEFLRRLNRVPLSAGHHLQVVEILREREHATGAGQGPLLNPDQRARILEHCGKSNAAFAREFLGGADAFAGTEDGARAAAPGYSQSQFMDTLEFVLPKLLARVNEPASPEALDPEQTPELG